MRLALLLLAILASLQSAYGAGPDERALKLAESRRDASLGAVTIAYKRVEAAQLHSDASDILEANLLLDRALEFMVAQEEELAAVRASVKGVHKILVIARNEKATLYAENMHSLRR